MQAAEMLLDRTVDSGHNSEQRRISSNSRKSLSLPILAIGEYELRTVTFIDPNSPGAEAHLLIDSVRVTDAFGAEATPGVAQLRKSRHAVGTVSDRNELPAAVPKLINA